MGVLWRHFLYPMSPAPATKPILQVSRTCLGPGTDTCHRVGYVVTLTQGAPLICLQFCLMTCVCAICVLQKNASCYIGVKLSAINITFGA